MKRNEREREWDLQWEREFGRRVTPQEIDAINSHRPVLYNCTKCISFLAGWGRLCAEILILIWVIWAVVSLVSEIGVPDFLFPVAVLLFPLVKFMNFVASYIAPVNMWTRRSIDVSRKERRKKQQAEWPNRRVLAKEHPIEHGYTHEHSLNYYGLDKINSLDLVDNDNDWVTSTVPTISPYQVYLQSDGWKKRRAEAIDRAGRRCQLCNSVDSLQVHHRTYERLGNELPADLIALCRSCHAKFHDVLP